MKGWKMVFGHRSLLLHLAKGIGGFGALALALHTMNGTLLPSILLIPAAIYLLRGCPICWTIGLFETLAALVHERSGRLERRLARPPAG